MSSRSRLLSIVGSSSRLFGQSNRFATEFHTSLFIAVILFDILFSTLLAHHLLLPKK
jgi:hypothetical protein